MVQLQLDLGSASAAAVIFLHNRITKGLVFSGMPEVDFFHQL